MHNFISFIVYIVSLLVDSRPENQTTTMQLTNPCVLCSEEEKCLACIPCGHLITCIRCGQVFRLCPICHTQIDAFVRIYK
jgi:hypothetical protein